MRGAAAATTAGLILLLAACSTGSRSAAPATSSPPAPVTSAAAPAALADVTCPPPTVLVRDAAGLTQALDAAGPGTSIRLQDGIYRGAFVLARGGEPGRPVHVCGGRAAVLDTGGTANGHYGLHLLGVHDVVVAGFTVQDAQKGVVTDRATRTTVADLLVQHIGDEGIHLRSFSSDDTVVGNTVLDTGLRRTEFGEGIYVGSAIKNWSVYSGGGPDRSDHDVIRGNHIGPTAAESIDIKEGTTAGQVLDNVFDGKGMSGAHADSWVDVKGDDWLIQGNVGSDSRLDGFQTHMIAKGWGDRNVFSRNVAHVNGPGYGFTLHGPLDNVVKCDNVVAGAAKGMSRTPCSH